MISFVSDAIGKQFPVPVVRAEDTIPHGNYCYTIKGEPSDGGNGVTVPINCCPFWKKLPGYPDQISGWCDHMQTGDMVAGGTDLLWDQVKECGVNYE